MEITDRIFVAGHRGMVGSAVVRLLKNRGVDNLILRTREELDLRDSLAVESFFDEEKPDVVILTAARVGGIKANMDYPSEFLYDNLTIQSSVIHQAYLHGVKKFCFLGSSCIYPRECLQPMKEEYLLTGALELTNEAYAIAKITGLKQVQYYRKQYGFKGISVIPCNLYGTDDSYDPLHSHVLSALVKKIVDAVDVGAESVAMWGTGIARREFMHVDDAAAAIILMTENYDELEIINIGWGRDITIKDLAALIAKRSGFKGKLIWDPTQPNGMLRKCMDVSKMRSLGFAPKITLEEGIEKTIAEYREIKRSAS
jgi:GDP-L-fucose synthase